MKTSITWLLAAVMLVGCEKKREQEPPAAEQGEQPAAELPGAAETAQADEKGSGGATREGEAPSLGEAGIEWVYSRPAGIEYSKSEITVAQYRACVEAGKCTEPKSKSDNKYCNWGHSGRDNHPVNCVNWSQSTAFCKWVGGRLPMEKKWYAEASNGGKREYPWGNQKATCDYAVMDQGGEGCGRDSTWPVCSKTAGNSVSGLCDMSGNLWEWTSSLYKAGSTARIVRGGSWYYDGPMYLRASTRFRRLPSYWSDRLGFRCGRSVE